MSDIDLEDAKSSMVFQPGMLTTLQLVEWPLILLYLLQGGYWKKKCGSTVSCLEEKWSDCSRSTVTFLSGMVTT